MGNALKIAGNNIRRMLKKKSNIFVYILLPPVLAVAFMLLISSGESSTVMIGITDSDMTASSASITRYIEESEKYETRTYTIEELETAVADKQVRAGIHIPGGFEEYLTEDGDIIKVEIFSIEGIAVTGWLKGFLNQKIAMLYKAGTLLEDKTQYTRVISEYNDKYVSVEAVEVSDISNKMSGTRAGFGMYTFASLFGIWAICALGFREKINKTYQRIMSGPVAPWQYIVGNSLACLFFASLHAVISLSIIYMIFDMKDLLPAGQFILLITVFYLAVIPLGFLLVSLGKSEAALLAVNVVFLTLTSMLGGCYWPVEFMPDFMQKMARGTIQFWFTDGINELMKYGDISAIKINLIVLACSSVVFIFIYIIIEKTKKNRMTV